MNDGNCSFCNVCVISTYHYGKQFHRNLCPSIYSICIIFLFSLCPSIYSVCIIFLLSLYPSIIYVLSFCLVCILQFILYILSLYLICVLLFILCILSFYLVWPKCLQIYLMIQLLKLGAFSTMASRK